MNTILEKIGQSMIKFFRIRLQKRNKIFIRSDYAEPLKDLQKGFGIFAYLHT